MAISVKHLFQSAKGDGSDATLVRPSNWNANHDIQMATSRVIGRLTAGAGVAEELPVTSYMMNLLNTADYAALAVLLGLPTTGDAKLTFKAAADAGWILANDGTVGDAGSGATRANVDTLALFTLFYSAPFTDAICPLQTTAGGATTRAANGTAANAFGTNKCRMVIPKTLGRALIIAGSGTGLSTRLLGETGGEEAHVLTANESVAHVHAQQGTFTGSGGAASGSGTISGTWVANGTAAAEATNHTHNTTVSGTSGTSSGGALDHTHANANACSNISTTGGGQFATGYQANVNTGSADRSLDHTHAVSFGALTSGAQSLTHTHAITNVPVTVTGGTCTINSVTVSTTLSGNTGSVTGFNGAAHNNMQPWTAWNVMIRL